MVAGSGTATAAIGALITITKADLMFCVATTNAQADGMRGEAQVAGAEPVDTNVAARWRQREAGDGVVEAGEHEGAEVAPDRVLVSHLNVRPLAESGRLPQYARRHFRSYSRR